MIRTKDLIMETLFATEEQKKEFENYNRQMNCIGQGLEPKQDDEEAEFEERMNIYWEEYSHGII